MASSSSVRGVSTSGSGPARHLRSRGAGVLPLVLVTTAAMVLLSSLWKGACLDASRNYPLTCYSDVLQLFSSRDLAHDAFPYVHGRLVAGAPVGTFEYPVLTGVFIWFSALFADSRAAFLVSSTALLLPFALLTGGLLARLTGRRALLWATAPALGLYALHNWDLLAVAATVAAFAAWRLERSVLAAALLAAGGCLKIYPLLFVLPLVLDRLSHRDRAGAGRAALASTAVVLAVNLPFVLINRSGWATTYVFQQQRAADASSNSIWFWASPAIHLSTSALNGLVAVLVLLALALASAYGVLRRRREGSYPFLQVCGAVLAVFLLVNKVHSPQYALWLLPFFALLRVGIGWWAAYAVADAAVYVGVFRWLNTLTHGGDHGPARDLLIAGVWTRAALLVALTVVFLRAQDALRGQPTQRPAVNVSVSTAISGAATAM